MSRAKLEALKHFARGRTVRRKRDFNLLKLNESPEVCNKCHEYIAFGNRSNKKSKLKPYRVAVSPVTKPLFSFRAKRSSRNRMYHSNRSQYIGSSRSRVGTRTGDR